jgi:hypothetical protein
MSYKQRRPACEAGRLGTASRFVQGGQQNNSNPYRGSLHRLPVSMRRRYLTDCRAADTAYRYLAEARRLLQGLQP